MNTCSTGAIRPFPNHAAYGSSKWALRGLTQAAAAELAASSIRVNAVFPGPVATPMLDEATQARLAAHSALGRIGTADEDRGRRGVSCPSRHPSSPVRSSSSTEANACKSDDRQGIFSRNHRRGPGRVGAGHLPEQGWFSRLHDLRPRRRRGRHVADQHLPGPGLRREIAPVLLLIRSERELVAAVVGQPEILDYFEQCTKRYELGGNLKLNTEITSAHWDADSEAWQLTTSPGERFTFDVVVSAIGLFTQPVLPDLLEEESFTGTLMHTARWDHAVDLRDARVAVLGTGSTAAQLVPEVAKVARKVYSVQRSPTWILPKPDRPYTDREKWVFAHVPFAKKIYRTRLWLRSESNISVIENGSDKTQEFRGIALRALGSDGAR